MAVCGLLEWHRLQPVGFSFVQNLNPHRLKPVLLKGLPQRALATLCGNLYFADALFQRPGREIGLLFVDHQRRRDSDCVFTGAEQE